MVQQGDAMLGIKILIGCKVVRDSGRGLAKHIRHDGIKRHIADGEGILETVLLTAFHRSEFVAVTGQLSQNTDILSWNEAAFYQADAEQVSNPLGIFGVILVTLYSFDPFWIGDDDANAPFFQDIVDRDPVLSSGLHADIQTVILMEPVGKVVQVRIKRREAFLLITGLQAILRSLNDGSHQKRFVNIHPAASWKYDFQSTPSLFQYGEEKAVTEPPSN